MCYSWLLPSAMLLGLVHLALGDETHCFPTGNCYTIHTTAMSFQKAVATCGSNGTLATMKNQQEKSEILQTIAQLAYKSNISALWLGLHLPACIVKDKELYGFVWISGGENTKVSEWEKIPRPTCTKKKRCVILKSRKDNSNNVSSAFWFWRNVECEKNYPLICHSNDTMPISTAKDFEVTHSTTEQYLPHMTLTSQHTESTSSFKSVNVLCRGFLGKVNFTCGLDVSYECNITHCSCGYMNRGHSMFKQCQRIPRESCLEQCIKAGNISCGCTDEQTPCECSVNIQKLPALPGTAAHSPSSSSAPPKNDDNLLDSLIVPLILGLVALGILLMLVWGGVQMCIRKKKPKRRKSIAPAPPEGNETDSTDHSSSDEDDDEDEEDEEEEPQDRTYNP